MFMFCNIFLLCCLSTFIAIQHCFISKSTCSFGSSNGSFYCWIRFFCVSSNLFYNYGYAFSSFHFFLLIFLVIFCYLLFCWNFIYYHLFFLFIYRNLCKLGYDVCQLNNFFIATLHLCFHSLAIFISLPWTMNSFVHSSVSSSSFKRCHNSFFTH